jgi:hypothetical protein
MSIPGGVSFCRCPFPICFSSVTIAASIVSIYDIVLSETLERRKRGYCADERERERWREDTSRNVNMLLTIDLNCPIAKNILSCAWKCVSIRRGSLAYR